MLYPDSNYNKAFIELANKMKYGAPELKKFYQKFLTKGLLIAILIHAIFISGYFYFLSLNDIKADTLSVRNPIDFDYYKVDPHDENERTNIDPPKNVKIKDPASLIPDPVKRINVKDDIIVKSNNELEDIHLPSTPDGTGDLSDHTGIPGNTGRLDGVKIDEVIERNIPDKTDHQVFEVDKAPVAVNLNSVRSSLKYPEDARKLEIEGKIIVKVLVGKDGNVIRVKKLSGPGIFFDEVSEKVLGLKFSQALINNEPVNCWVNVPFSFVLKSKSENDHGEEGDN
ncbi:MAG: energy transducer TonB [Ignavibacteria bacterium]